MSTDFSIKPVGAPATITVAQPVSNATSNAVTTQLPASQSVTATDPGAAARFASHPAFAGWPLLVLSDEPRRAAASPINFLWTTFTRFEPAADIHAAATETLRNHIAYHPPVLIDARLKPGFPRELHADPETAALVTRRWREYFPGGGVEMGDSNAAHLDRP